MAHITLRLDDAMAARVQTLCDERKESRSAMLKELLALGLEISSGTVGSVYEAVMRLSGQMEELHAWLSEAQTSYGEMVAELKQAGDAQFELLVKLGIENVMINRAMALTRGRQFLLDAQASARDYYAQSPKDPPPAAPEEPDAQDKVA